MIFLLVIRETKASSASDTNEVVRREGRCQQEDVVRLKLRNSSSSRRELKRHAELLIELNVLLYLVVRSRDTRLSHERDSPLLKHLKALRVSQVPVCLRNFIPRIHIGDGRGGSITLGVLDERDCDDCRGRSPCSRSVSEIPLALDRLDDALASDTRGLGDSLRDEAQLPSDRHLTRGVDSERVRRIEELKLTTTAGKASVEALSTGVPRATAFNTLIRHTGLRSTSTTC